MFNALFRNVSETDKNAAIENIVKHASPRPDFFLMLALSVSMATFGVILGDVVVLIASMLIAPLLYPILSLALGVAAADEKLVGRSFYTILKSTGIALAASAVIGFLFAPRGSTELLFGNFLGGQGSPFGYVIVAAIAGFAAAFALVKPRLSETLPGAAIAVALVPPLARAGVGIAFFSWTIVSSALLLFVVNVIGIVFSALIVFSMLRFAFKKDVTEEAIKEEEETVKQEAVIAESLGK